MNWQVRLRLVREQPLSDEERDTLLAHVRTVTGGPGPGEYDLAAAREARPDGLLAAARLDMYYADAHDGEVQRLLQALTTLRGLLPDTALEVADDFELIGWSDGAQRYETVGHNDGAGFELPVLGEGFTSLASLPWDHRFARAVSHRASRIEAAVEAGEEAALRVDGDPRFTTAEHLGETRTVLTSWVANALGLPVRVERVEVLLSDAQALPVDHDWESVELWVRERARLSVPLPGPPEAHRHAAEVQLSARCAARFQARLGRWALAADTGQTLQLDAPEQGEASPWPVRVAVGGWVDAEAPEREWRVCVEMEPLRPGSGFVELWLDLQDEAGHTLASEALGLELDGGPARVATTVRDPGGGLVDVRAIALSAEITVRWTEELGRYALP